MADRRSLSSLLGALGAAALLTACQGGGSSAPALPPPGHGTQALVRAPQSSARATQQHHQSAPPLSANPASLEFTADQVAASPPVAQTVTVAATSDGELSVSIAGTGNCPLVSPATLRPKRVDEDGDHDRDRRDAKRGVITVTPNGAGPASCTITVARSGRDHDDADGHEDHDRKDDRDRKDDHDGDHHGQAPAAGDALVIPVTVDAPATPVPTPTPIPVPTQTPTPVPTATPTAR